MTIEDVIELAPDRIALFNFAYLPRLKPNQRHLPSGQMPSPAEKFSIFCRSIARLQDANFAFIGMDHFAKENDPLALAARAALRSGVGLVTVLVPRAIVSVVAGLVPEAMVHGVAETDAGSLASGMWPVWRERRDAFSAILAGPGMTRHTETAALVRLMLAGT